MKYRNYFIIFLILFVFIFVLFNATKKQSCDYIIVLDSKEKIRARNINWYQSGFVDIRKCDGKSITYREVFIDTVIVNN
jgi:hypothetical protein